MKQLLREMGEAINDSLTASTELTATIERIRQEGYDIFLILEATIGLNPKSGDESEPSEGRLPASSIEITAGTADKTRETADCDQKQEMVFQVSPDDEQFLRSLKISVDDSAIRPDDQGPAADDDDDSNDSE